MCGRYLRRSDKQRIGDAFRLGKLPDGFVLPPDYNIAPTTFQPVIRESGETGERELVMMRWGLIPHFAKSLADCKGLLTINARAESIAISPTWRVPFRRRRCLVPADGFYEWQRLDAKTKRPYSFTLRNGALFAFAGLWDIWKEPDGGLLESFSIVTTEANELMAAVHTRMPVILHRRDYARWLSRLVTDDHQYDLLRPYESDEMKSACCNPLVGNVKNNGPEMLNSA